MPSLLHASHHGYPHILTQPLNVANDRSRSNPHRAHNIPWARALCSATARLASLWPLLYNERHIRYCLMFLFKFVNFVDRYGLC